jgi:hypothetical protein
MKSIREIAPIGTSGRALDTCWEAIAVSCCELLLDRGLRLGELHRVIPLLGSPDALLEENPPGRLTGRGEIGPALVKFRE